MVSAADSRWSSSPGHPWGPCIVLLGMTLNPDHSASLLPGAEMGTGGGGYPVID